MTDSNWGDVGAPKKPAVPTWLWFCGAGCLVVLILGAVVIKFGFDYVKDWGVAEEQLPALREAIPFDELPAETQFEVAIRFPMDWYVFQDTRGFVMLFFVARGRDGEELRRTVLNPEFNGFGMGRRTDAKPAEIVVQGREVRGQRFVQERGSGDGGRAQGASVLLEIGPEDGSHVVLVQITRAGTADVVTDEDVRMLLKPFHVGPDR